MQKELDDAQICVKSKTKSTNVYIEALSIRILCSPIQRQSTETLNISKYNYYNNCYYNNIIIIIKNLDFADKYTSDNSEKSPLIF